MCKITNYISFNILRKLTSYLNTIDEFDGGKGKQVHEHSHKKQKHTQDFKYLNLPKQLYVLLQTVALFDQENSVQSPSFFLTEIILHQRPSHLPLENRGAIYTKTRGLIASWITIKANKYNATKVECLTRV